MAKEKSKEESEPTTGDTLKKVWKHPAAKVAAFALGTYALVFVSRYLFDAAGKAAAAYNRMKGAFDSK